MAPMGSCHRSGPLQMGEHMGSSKSWKDLTVTECYQGLASSEPSAPYGGGGHLGVGPQTGVSSVLGPTPCVFWF